MSQWPNLAVAIGVSLAVSTCIVLALARPLRSLLEQMCPSGDGARWWFSFTAVMLYVTPLMFAIWATGTIAAADPVAIVRGALGASLFGTFAALLVIGQQIPRDRERARERDRDRGRF